MEHLSNKMTHFLWICVALLLHSCEAFDKLPDGNECFSLIYYGEDYGDPCTDSSSLGGVVAEWIKGGTARATVVDKYGEIETWDTSDVLSLQNVFYKKDSFNEDISKWDTSQVTDMTFMFAYATAFNNGGQPLDWDTSKVTDMHYMFYEAKAFNGDISQWNTASVTTMERIFYDSGFSRTLCGGAWDSLTGDKSAFNTLGTSTARYGCCPAGSFMSDPFVSFTEANSCSQCTAGIFGTNVKNDEPACTNCIAGKSNPSGTSDISLCQNCQAGQSSTAGALCQNCQAGRFSVAGALCQDCQAGMYSLPGEACKNYSVQWLKNAYNSIGGTC